MSSNDTLTLRVSEDEPRITTKENFFKIKNKCFETASRGSLLIFKAINIAFACYHFLVAIITHSIKKQEICKIYIQKKIIQNQLSEIMRFKLPEDLIEATVHRCFMKNLF